MLKSLASGPVSDQTRGSAIVQVAGCVGRHHLSVVGVFSGLGSALVGPAIIGASFTSLTVTVTVTVPLPPDGSVAVTVTSMVGLVSWSNATLVFS